MPKALYCVLMLNTEVVVMELRLMFCSEDTVRTRERDWKTLLSLSLSLCPGCQQRRWAGVELASNWRAAPHPVVINHRACQPLLRTSQWHSALTHREENISALHHQHHLRWYYLLLLLWLLSFHHITVLNTAVLMTRSTFRPTLNENISICFPFFLYRMSLKNNV